MKFNPSRQAFLQRIGSIGQLLPIFDLLPEVSFFIKDRKGCFVALNKRSCEYLGVKSEREAFGKTDLDYIPQARAEQYIADDKAVMRSGKPILNRVEPAPEAEGSPHLVITNKIPLRDAAGRVIGIAGFSRRVEQVRRGPAEMKKLAAAVDFLHRNHAQPIAAEALARHAGLSVSQFERTFRKAFGTTPRQYLLGIRIEHASRRLAETDDIIANIALECGFYDHAHFTRAFTAATGITPSQYRREHQAPQI